MKNFLKLNPSTTSAIISPALKMFLGPPQGQFSDSTRMVIFEDDEMEVRRLRHLFEENILKVEKENMEIIKKMTNSNIVISSESNVRKPKETKPKEVIKRTTKLGMKRLVSSKALENQRDSEAKLSLKFNSLSHDTRSECVFSNIHFLNHFESSFLSTNVNAQNKSSELYTSCAIPLAPPIQKRSVSVRRPISSNSGKNEFFQNTVLHHVTSEVSHNKLSIQVLPSITIHETLPKCHKNVLNEEIRKKDYFEGDGIRTTILPAISNEEKMRLSKIKLTSLNPKKTSGLAVKEGINEDNQTSKPVSTEVSESKPLVRNIEEQEKLKEIFKEVLQNLAFSSDKDCKENPNLIDEKIPDTLSAANDCALDSFLGNIENIPRHSVDKNMSNHVATTQTNREDSSAEVLTKRQIKDMIQEILLEMQLSSSDKDKLDAENQKKHKEVQTKIATCEKETQESIVSSPKSTQVCLREDASVKCDSATETPAIVIETNPTDDIASQHSEVHLISRLQDDSRLLTVLNSIYKKLCVPKVPNSQDSISVVSRDIPPISTREVSVQFNPVSTLTKSTCTSDIPKIDASEQCSLLSPTKEPARVVKHAQVQAEIAVPEPNPTVPPQTSDTFVQCDKPALIDSVSQTVEYVIAPPEHSANTSVSTTPVSDSMFLDDMLSEGEVFLPCNLRLSGSDKTATSSTKKETDLSGISDKDQDYSLSEGEIHPKYLQQLEMQKPSTDGYIGSQTMPSSFFYKNAGRVNPESKFKPSFERSCYSSSSLSEGEVRCCSTPLSEGEIPPHLWQNIPRPSFQSMGTLQSPGAWNTASNYPFSSHRSDLLLDLDPRIHYHLSASQEELDGGISTVFR